MCQQLRAETAIILADSPGRFHKNHSVVSRYSLLLILQVAHGLCKIDVGRKFRLGTVRVSLLSFLRRVRIGTRTNRIVRRSVRIYFAGEMTILIEHNAAMTFGAIYAVRVRYFLFSLSRSLPLFVLRLMLRYIGLPEHRNAMSSIFYRSCKSLFQLNSRPP